MRRAEVAFRAGLTVAAAATVVWAALPLARHMSGIVVTETEAPTERPVSPPPKPPDFAALFALAPFGRPPELTVPTAPQPSERPDIVLRGIFAGRDAESTALLDVGGEPGLYRETMRVADALDVTRISHAFVELSDGETTITLRFDTDAEIDAPAPTAESEAAPSLLDRLQGGFVVAAKYEKPGQPETTAEYIDYWRHRIRKNPQAVLDEIGLLPTDQGYVIADSHDVGVRLAGLRSGDLVRKVNGQPVGNPDADTKFYDQIAAAGQARIEVERGGRILSFSFPLR